MKRIKYNHFLVLLAVFSIVGFKQARAEIPDNSSSTIEASDEPGCNDQDDSGCTEEEWDAVNS